MRIGAAELMIRREVFLPFLLNAVSVSVQEQFSF